MPSHWRTLDYNQNPEPMIYVDLKIENISLKLFTTLSSFGTPIDITAEEIVIEQYFPANDVTKRFFEEA